MTIDYGTGSTNTRDHHQLRNGDSNHYASRKDQLEKASEGSRSQLTVETE